MIPTLFGVTVVSFCIMQLAPGDPLLLQLSASGSMGESAQTRAAYLIQKRDLKLDLPLIFNVRYFRDYSEVIRHCAHYLGRPVEEIEAELPGLARAETNEAHGRLAFLQSLGIDEFDQRLANPLAHERLARAIQGYAQIRCEDLGKHAVPRTIELLSDPDTPVSDRVGLVRALGHMVVEPMTYTYSREPNESETPLVTASWRRWWELTGSRLPAVSSSRAQSVREAIRRLAQESSRNKLFEELERFTRSDLPVFAQTLVGESSLAEKVVCALALRLYVPGSPLATTLPSQLPVDLDRLDVVIGNWLAHYEARASEYQPATSQKLGRVLADTQYAHMVWRLVTFDFGRSALKTREPVSQKIWNAVIVSAPIILLAEILVYLVALPCGIVCAVWRGTSVDRGLTLLLFLVYSTPSFVAGMLFLLFFCYGDYFELFPMMGLHSHGADRLGPWAYLVDYLWHITLPVICLSLFSLAGLAMYARTAMLDVIGQDYVRTARAKGQTETKVVLKHALRNALIPIITLFSSFLPAMLGGNVLIEYLFGIPGMGRLSWESIEQKDVPTLMALLYIDAIVVMASILLTDLLYVWVDPRISFEGQGEAA